MAQDMEFDFSVPDRIPDEILADYQSDARRRVRRSRRSRTMSLLRSWEVWSVALVVFSVMVSAVALLGGLIYAIVTWPWVGLAVVAPAMVVLGVSLMVAVRAHDRWKVRGVW